MRGVTDRRGDMAAMFARAKAAKSSPTGAAIHVPAPIGENPADDDKKKRRRLALAKALGGRGLPYTITKADRDRISAIAKGANSEQYVGRLVLNEAQLREWWALVKLPGEPDLDPNPHVTVAYSSAAFDWTPDTSWVAVSLLPQPDAFDTLGPDKAVVARVDSPILESRWAATLQAGATWSHDGYKPHVTLFYLGAGYDSDSWRDGGSGAVTVPPFPILLGPELIGMGGVDPFEAAKAPSWYTPK